MTRTPDRGILDLPIGAIDRNPQQPRISFDEATIQDLARSIKDNGLLQPILVRKNGDGRYELVAGERRLRAARIAGLETIPATVRELSDRRSLELAMIENLQREDLGPLERARAYERYLDAFGVSIEELAGRLAESRANVSNYLRLLKLRPEIHMMIGAGQLAMGQARAIAGIADPERQLAVARIAARRSLSVRQVEELAKTTREPEAPDRQGPGDGSDQHRDDVEQALSRALGLRVALRSGRKKNSGRVIIQYNSLEEFDRIAECIGGRRTLES